MDHISNLPKHVLHDILSRLSQKEATRTSILSKSWNHTWSTFPILDFDEFQYGEPKYLEPENSDAFMRKRKQFVDSVDIRLQRFHDQFLALKQFKLKIAPFEPHYIAPNSLQFDHWMNLAIESGVEVLDIALNSGCIIPPENFYCLPTSLLEAKSLIMLILNGGFIINVHEFLNRSIQFTSLQVLSLSRVHLGDERVFYNLISSCVFIEHITLNCCTGLKSVTITGLPRLKEVKIVQIQDVIVDAPNLENFFYYPYFTNLIPSMPSLHNCTYLRDLFLDGNDKIAMTITNQWLVELFHKFPLMQRLNLMHFTIVKKIKISSLHLKVLKISWCNGLEEAHIDAPNLYKCEFISSSLYLCDFSANPSKMPLTLFMNSTGQMEVNVSFVVKLSSDFKKLREFLQSFSHKKNALILDICSEETLEFNVDVLPDISVAPPSIKHLELNVALLGENSYLPVIGALLWSCRPANIVMKLTSDSCNIPFAKLLRERLMAKDDSCCADNQIKFWWHCLKGVKVTSSSQKDENAFDFKTLLDALPITPQEEEIIFRLY